MNRLILSIFFIQTLWVLTCFADDEAVIHSDDPVYLKNLFKSYKAKNGKSYKSSSHENQKFEVFKNKTKKISEHNRAYKNGSVSWFMSLNQYSDMTQDELKNLFNPILSNFTSGLRANQTHLVRSRRDLPTTVDYRAQLPPIKQQGSCGSCWAFAASATMEHQYYRATKRVVSLSEEQITGCTYASEFNRDPCKGGNGEVVWQNFKNKGIVKSSDFPYQAGRTLRVTGDSWLNSWFSNWFGSSPADETAVKTAIANNGAVYVTLHASPETGSGVMDYGGGIFRGPCKEIGDHAVALVGYGPGYYLLRNSWDTTWGEKGYMRIAPGVCGIHKNVAYPSISVLA